MVVKGILVATVSVFAALNVPFTVSNWADVARDTDAVSAGMPLPADAVTDLTKLHVVNGSGVTVPAQFKALSRWWYEKNTGMNPNPSIKWVLMDFQATVPAAGQTSFRLKDDNSAGAPSTPLTVTDSTDKIMVVTGPLKFTISKQAFNLFDEAWLDADHDGLYETTEKIIASNTANGGAITAGDWAAGGCVEGTVHTTNQAAPAFVKIIEQGPLKVVLHAEGRHYAAASGVSKGLYGWQAYITAYAGRAYVDVNYAVTNTYMEGDKPELGATPYTAYSWPFKKYILTLNLNLSGSQSYALLGQSEVTGNASASASRLAQDSGAFTVTGVSGGVTAKGGVALADGSLGIMAALRDFGPNYPKAISVTQGQIIFELFPDKGTVYSLDPYSRKSQRMRLEFFSGALTAGKLDACWKKADAPLRALADDPAWYRDTRAWDGGFALAPGLSRKAPGAWVRYAKPAYGGVSEYGYNSGWDRYGYIQGFNGVGDHWNLSTCYGNYLITGDPTEFEYAEHRTFYFNDMAPVHTSENRVSDLSFLLNPEAHLSEFSQIHNPGSYYQTRFTTFPGFAWHRNNQPDDGHMPNYQVLEYYYLTGDPAAYTSMLDQGVRAATCMYYRTYGAYSGWPYSVHHGTLINIDSFIMIPYGPRYVGRPLFVSTQAYEVTGDSLFFKPARIYAYCLRNAARRSPIGFISESEDSVSGGAYGASLFSRWRTAYPGVRLPRSAVTAQFQNAIAIRALYKYWEETRDEEIRDAVILTSKHLEHIAALQGNVYKGWEYTWADYWGSGARVDSGVFTSTAGEALGGECYGYLIAGQRELFKVLEGALPTYQNTFADHRLMCYYQSLWKRWQLDTVPPATVTNLMATSPMDSSGWSIVLNWTAPGGDGTAGRAASYQVKCWQGAPIVDFVKRWNPADSTGWPDLRAPLPATNAEYLAKARNYITTREISFWAADNVADEPTPSVAGSSETFHVSGLKDAASYYFALVSYDSSGNVSGISNVVQATTGIETHAKGTARFALYGNSPNPFNPLTTVRYALPGIRGEKRVLRLQVLDIQGRIIRTLVNGEQEAGVHTVVWDGRDASGRGLGSGVYLCRLMCGKLTMQKQMVYLR
ncbi:MAG: FlgD immunoglobulin-like domain containing protein [Fibrobacterota bacterium]